MGSPVWEPSGPARGWRCADGQGGLGSGSLMPGSKERAPCRRPPSAKRGPQGRVEGTDGGRGNWETQRLLKGARLWAGSAGADRCP